MDRSLHGNTVCLTDGNNFLLSISLTSVRKMQPARSTSLTRDKDIAEIKRPRLMLFRRFYAIQSKYGPDHVLQFCHR
jgi:hypothetical protein